MGEKRSLRNARVIENDRADLSAERRGCAGFRAAAAGLRVGSAGAFI